MVEKEVKVEILNRLKNTEEKEGVRILMAIESGSRAWGFASPKKIKGSASLIVDQVCKTL